MCTLDEQRPFIELNTSDERLYISCNGIIPYGIQNCRDSFVILCVCAQLTFQYSLVKGHAELVVGSTIEPCLVSDPLFYGSSFVDISMPLCYIIINVTEFKRCLVS